MLWFQSVQSLTTVFPFSFYTVQILQRSIVRIINYDSLLVNNSWAGTYFTDRDSLNQHLAEQLRSNNTHIRLCGPIISPWHYFNRCLTLKLEQFFDIEVRTWLSHLQAIISVQIITYQCLQSIYWQTRLHVSSVNSTTIHSVYRKDTMSYLEYWIKVAFLTHWGRVTQICVSKLSILGSDNGLSPGRRQAII